MAESNLTIPETVRKAREQIDQDPVHEAATEPWFSATGKGRRGTAVGQLAASDSLANRLVLRQLDFTTKEQRAIWGIALIKVALIGALVSLVLWFT